MRPAGFWLSILTVRHGLTTHARSSRHPEQRACRSPSERSRSGEGGHVWIFFASPVPARDARLGAWLVTRTMERRPEIGFASYDRFFPSQDTMPLGGFGNLIALPLQSQARARGNSVFVDDQLRPYQDQWAYLASVPAMEPVDLSARMLDPKVAGGLFGGASGCRWRTRMPTSLGTCRRRVGATMLR